MNKKQDKEQLNKHREAILTFRAWAVNRLLTKNTSVLDVILMYAEATHYIKHTLKNDYTLIKENEAPIVQRIKNIVLRRIKNLKFFPNDKKYLQYKSGNTGFLKKV